MSKMSQKFFSKYENWQRNNEALARATQRFGRQKNIIFFVRKHNKKPADRTKRLKENILGKFVVCEKRKPYKKQTQQQQPNQTKQTDSIRFTN